MLCRGLQASPPGARSTVTHLELSGDLSRCGYSTVNSLAEQGPGWGVAVSVPIRCVWSEPCTQQATLPSDVGLRLWHRHACLGTVAAPRPWGPYRPPCHRCLPTPDWPSPPPLSCAGSELPPLTEEENGCVPCFSRPLRSPIDSSFSRVVSSSWFSSVGEVSDVTTGRGPAFQVPGIKAPFLACAKPKTERKPHKQSGGGEERRGARKAFLGTPADHLSASVLSPCQAPGKWENEDVPLFPLGGGRGGRGGFGHACLSEEGAGSPGGQAEPYLQGTCRSAGGFPAGGYLTGGRSERGPRLTTGGLESQGSALPPTLLFRGCTCVFRLWHLGCTVHLTGTLCGIPLSPGSVPTSPPQMCARHFSAAA